MDTQEREFVIRHLRDNRERLLRMVDKLSPEQRIFRPAEDQWSIADCLEHISIAEDHIYRGIHRALRAPPAPEKRAEVERKTEKLLRAVLDRDTRVKGPEVLMPRRAWKDFSELIEGFETMRIRTIGFASVTEAELHNHFFPHIVFQDLDCYQWLLMASLHCDRHILQMEEVKEDAGYPKRNAVTAG